MCEERYFVDVLILILGGFPAMSIKPGSETMTNTTRTAKDIDVFDLNPVT